MPNKIFSYKYDYDISIWKKNKYIVVYEEHYVKHHHSIGKWDTEKSKLEKIVLDDKIISRQNIFKIKINNEIIFIECHGRPIQLCDLQGNYIKNIQYSYVMCFNDNKLQVAYYYI